MSDRRICVGVITGPHGVRGLVKVLSFTERPEDIVAYGPLTDRAGKAFSLDLVSTAKDRLVMRVAGLVDRDQAEAVKGTKLYVDRAALPAPEDEEEFYVVDLIGLEAFDTKGKGLGRVAEVFNAGGGEVIEIDRGGGERISLPFTRRVVPEVDLEGGRVVIDPPEELWARPEGPDAEEEA